MVKSISKTLRADEKERKEFLSRLDFQKGLLLLEQMVRFSLIRELHFGKKKPIALGKQFKHR